MTFPVREATAGENHASSQTYAVDWPSGSTTGDIIIVWILTQAAGFFTWTPPTGFTALGTTANQSRVGFWKKFDGSEGSSGNFVHTATAAVASSLAERWSGGDSVESANDFSENSPNLAPSWGSADTAWIASILYVALGTHTQPANYGNLVTHASGTVKLQTSNRELAASSENPGAWSSSSGSPRSWTVAIEPAAGGGGGLDIPIAYHHYRTMMGA